MVTDNCNPQITTARYEREFYTQSFLFASFSQYFFEHSYHLIAKVLSALPPNVCANILIDKNTFGSLQKKYQETPVQKDSKLHRTQKQQ